LDGITGNYLRTDKEKKAEKKGQGEGAAAAAAAGAEEGDGSGDEDGKHAGGVGAKDLPEGAPVGALTSKPFPLPGASTHAKWFQTLVADLPFRRALMRPEALLLFEVSLGQG
jgi:hypothetical protein